MIAHVVERKLYCEDYLSTSRDYSIKASYLRFKSKDMAAQIRISSSLRRSHYHAINVPLSFRLTAEIMSVTVIESYDHHENRDRSQDSMVRWRATDCFR